MTFEPYIVKRNINYSDRNNSLFPTVYRNLITGQSYTTLAETRLKGSYALMYAKQPLLHAAFVLLCDDMKEKVRDERRRFGLERYPVYGDNDDAK